MQPFSLGGDNRIEPVGPFPEVPSDAVRRAACQAGRRRARTGFRGARAALPQAAAGLLPAPDVVGLVRRGRAPAGTAAGMDGDPHWRRGPGPAGLAVPDRPQRGDLQPAPPAPDPGRDRRHRERPGRRPRGRASDGGARSPRGARRAAGDAARRACQHRGRRVESRGGRPRARAQQRRRPRPRLPGAGHAACRGRGCAPRAADRMVPAQRRARRIAGSCRGAGGRRVCWARGSARQGRGNRGDRRRDRYCRHRCRSGP